MLLLRSLPRRGAIILVFFAFTCGILTGYVLTHGGATETCFFGLRASASSRFWSSLAKEKAREELLYLETVSDIVSRTRGYYARDFSLELGWNNMRYIIEAVVYHAALLNRTAIIPSFVYARSCEFTNSVCVAYAPMVNRGDALRTDQWRDLPEDEQMGWKIPIDTVLNVTRLQEHYSVILVSDYLRLHSLSPDLENSTGQWDTTLYHQNPSVFEANLTKVPSMHTIKNDWFDPEGTTRVDVIPEEMKQRGQWDVLAGDPNKDESGRFPNVTRTEIYDEVLTYRYIKAEDRVPAVTWEHALLALSTAGVLGAGNPDEIAEVLQGNGMEVVYTYKGAHGMDFVKNVASAIQQVVPRESIRGFVDDFGDIEADVLYLEGEVHDGRKPGSLRFTTPERRDTFSEMVLYDTHAPQAVYDLAAKLANRMVEMNEGRMWIAAHMRRGDFVSLGWAIQDDFVSHFNRIAQQVINGRLMLERTSFDAESITPYNVPNVIPNIAFYQREPPKEGDKFYIATDERDPANLAYLREHGAVLIADLLTDEDRRAFGWGLMLTDVLGLVEQALLARSHFMYGHSLSSVAGGAINLRAADGLDSRTVRFE
ncbi:hypothetical protein CONPUDRAFT_162695 [Coniophora puteana RWD-64-598 SS2]|uniref:O-fucosyltransferase family protein n=1 Tax=Coniophora puteana (strain RWD-64-598) TaxID=741705 RepID=A0A5M3N296_CONPW|nr:uncharacterized protein CONPUDRAFT_162695 [Coniophora puteana RWD-64-598 SS2]EIW85510.1 hypothetical protein CONPUDRAFT_162695 [Coniophora puteana RWD-64-598 SS2]